MRGATLVNRASDAKECGDSKCDVMGREEYAPSRVVKETCEPAPPTEGSRIAQISGERVSAEGMTEERVLIACDCSGVVRPRVILVSIYNSCIALRVDRAFVTDFFEAR
jgi:hypothetical protein